LGLPALKQERLIAPAILLLHKVASYAAGLTEPTPGAPAQGSGLPALKQERLNAPAILLLHKVASYAAAKLADAGVHVAPAPVFYSAARRAEQARGVRVEYLDLARAEVAGARTEAWHTWAANTWAELGQGGRASAASSDGSLLGAAWVGAQAWSRAAPGCSSTDGDRLRLSDL